MLLRMLPRDDRLLYFEHAYPPHTITASSGCILVQMLTPDFVPLPTGNPAWTVRQSGEPSEFRLLQNRTLPGIEFTVSAFSSQSRIRHQSPLLSRLQLVLIRGNCVPHFSHCASRTPKAVVVRLQRSGSCWERFPRESRWRP